MCSKKPRQEEGSSVDPSPLILPASSLASSLGGSSRDPVHLVYAPRQVFCGGDQTFVLVDVVVRWPTTGHHLETFLIMFVS